MRTLLLSSVVLAFASLAVARMPGEIGFRNGLPCVETGFGVRRNFYQSGRISARVSDIAGVFQVSYIGHQDFRKSVFLECPAENCVFNRNLMLTVLIDDVPYRLPYGETTHYPFGFTSDCRIDGVALRQALVLDRNVLFRRVQVLDKPEGKAVRVRLVQMNTSLQQGCRWRMNECRTGLLASTADTRLEIGSYHPARLPLNDRPANLRAFASETGGTMDLRFNLEETEPHDDHLFWLAFDRTEEEGLSPSRVERVFADFASARTNDMKIESGDALYDNTLSLVVPMSRQFEVDGQGGFRASPSYWVWGWDAMVHFGSFAAFGRAEEVKRMLRFFARHAHPEKGILHCFPADFTVGDTPEAIAASGAMTMPPHVQLFYVVLLNDYVNITGDEETKAELLPFARKLVARAKSIVHPGEVLARALMS